MGNLGTEEDLHPNFWFRTFYRGRVQKENTELHERVELKADRDQIADETFQNQNFVDHFGKLLRKDQEFRKLNTYDELCSWFWDDKNATVQTYCVADGQGVPEADQRGWFRSTLRFISLILPTDDAHPKHSRAPISSISWAPWFLCVAASSAIKSEKDILHVMSWSQEDGQFRYYARDVIQDEPPKEEGPRAWVYLCNSEDAFDESDEGKAYLGPLNGHVNGGLVMKELHKPWLHWFSGGRNLSELLPAQLGKDLQSAKWLTAPGYPPLYGASVKSAENFESIVLDSLRMWFERRQSKDFLDDKDTTKLEPLHIQRWAAHFLLTTNTNIIAVPTSESIVPTDHFFNYETLRGYSDLLPNSVQKDPDWQKQHPYNPPNEPRNLLQNLGLTPEQWYQSYDLPTFRYDPAQYMTAARKLKVCTLQEVEPGTDDSIEFDRETMTGGVYMGSLENGNIRVEGENNIAFAVSQWGEGDHPWVILQASVEDAMGVWKAQKMFLGSDYDHSHCRLFSDRVFNALMILDFWNPIFSWKRLRLMQYVPVGSKLIDEPVDTSQAGDQIYTYDFEKTFLANIAASEVNWDMWEKEGGKPCPEREFTTNLDEPLINHQIRIKEYTEKIASNLRADMSHLLDYLKLAESRRRLFRPLPMNFFGNNLPYCLAMPPDAPYLEMTEDGEVREMPQIGMKWLHQWLGALAGSDPTVTPTPNLEHQRADASKPPVPRAALPHASTMRMQCQASIVMTNPRSAGGCPFMAQAYKQHLVE